MPRARSMDDRVLSLLALHPFPFTIADLVLALDSERSWVVSVLHTLELAGKVVRLATPGASSSAVGGRPAALWSLPGARLAPPELIPLMRRLMPGTAIVTPSGREAIVRALFHDGFARIQFTDGDKGDTTIHVKLLRAFQAGRSRPEPVRMV